MQLSELAGGSQRDLPWLLISGFGAHRLLSQEIGLHVLELADEERPRPGGRAGAARRRPAGRIPPDKLRAALADALARGPQPHAVVRRYRSLPSPLVRNMMAAGVPESSTPCCAATST